ncbi:MAG: hypothetical protein ACTHNW_15795 [Mucilaginibacter sp.]
MKQYKVKDFFDVRFLSKILSTQYFVYCIPYENQKPAKTTFFSRANLKFARAVHDHYCLTLVECPFEFNFDTLLAHFEWFAEFMYFNFSAATLEFDILDKLKNRKLNNDQADLLIHILDNHPAPYEFDLNTYQDRAKFALLKRQNISENGAINTFLERDAYFRNTFKDALLSIKNDLKKGTPEPLADQPVVAKSEERFIAESKKYEPSVYGYLRLNETLTEEQRKDVINFLYDLLKDLFFKNYSFQDFQSIFTTENSQPIMLDISIENTYHIDAQKLHWLIRSLRDTQKLLPVGWEVIRKKLIVYNQHGHLVGTAYQISETKIPVQKKRQVQKLLQPLFDKLTALPQ